MASRPLEFHREAEKEYLTALSWYRERSLVAASNLENMNRIRANPQTMRNLLMTVLLSLGTLVTAEEAGTKRIALTPNSTVSSGDISHGLESKCSGLVLTLDTSKADYLLEAREDYRRNGVRNGFTLTLFSPSGDVLFHTNARGSDNAVKDICKSIRMEKTKK